MSFVLDLLGLFASLDDQSRSFNQWFKASFRGLSTSINSLNQVNIGANSTMRPINKFEYLGLVPELVDGLSAQGLTEPTPVQRSVIPRLLTRENLVMAASTGSGKTLAYVLPTAQLMQAGEFLGYKRLMKRPRCLVLVPTRELARQVLMTVKSLSHYCKLSSTALMGGEDMSLQRRSLDRLVDVVVGSPERVLQHKERGNLLLSQVTHVIIDEVDTMLTQGFGSDIRAILRSVMLRRNASSSSVSSDVPLSPKKSKESIIDTEWSAPSVQLVMATATLTRAVKALLTDVDGEFNIEFNDPTNLTPRKHQAGDTTFKINIVEVDGVHRTLPHVRHDVEEVKGADKLSVLEEVLTRYDSKNFRTMVFCNTIDSARAVDYALTEGGRQVQSYHGDLNSKERSDGLDRFRSGERQLLVCTDIAARGIDIPEVDHIIMFDFPLNPVDYIHRAGRCGRAGRKGLVTALVAKRDKVLSDAIQGAIARGLPIDELSSSKRDYQDKGKLAAVVGRQTREQANDKARREAKLRIISGSRLAPGASVGSGMTSDIKAKLKSRIAEGANLKKSPTRSAMDARMKKAAASSDSSAFPAATSTSFRKSSSPSRSTPRSSMAKLRTISADAPPSNTREPRESRVPKDNSRRDKASRPTSSDRSSSFTRSKDSQGSRFSGSLRTNSAPSSRSTPRSDGPGRGERSQSPSTSSPPRASARPRDEKRSSSRPSSRSSRFGSDSRSSSKGSNASPKGSSEPRSNPFSSDTRSSKGSSTSRPGASSKRSSVSRAGSRSSKPKTMRRG